MSPNARCLKELRLLGYQCQTVESWIPHVNIRRDLFGVIDIVAVRPGFAVLGVQATSGDNHGNRIRKARAEARLRPWLKAGCTFEVWAWAKVDGRWRCRKTPLALSDVKGVVPIYPPKRKRKSVQLTLFDDTPVPA